MSSKVQDKEKFAKYLNNHGVTFFVCLLSIATKELLEHLRVMLMNQVSVYFHCASLPLFPPFPFECDDIASNTESWCSAPYNSTWDDAVILNRDQWALRTGTVIIALRGALEWQADDSSIISSLILSFPSSATIYLPVVLFHSYPFSHLLFYPLNHLPPSCLLTHGLLLSAPPAPLCEPIHSSWKTGTTAPQEGCVLAYGQTWVFLLIATLMKHLCVYACAFSHLRTVWVSARWEVESLAHFSLSSTY